MLDQFCSTCMRDGMDLILHCPLMQYPRNARVPVWAQLCSTRKKARTAESLTRLDGPLAPHIHSASYPVLPATHTIPGRMELTVWLRYTEVNRRSELGRKQLGGGSTDCDVNTVIQDRAGANEAYSNRTSCVLPAV